MINARSKELFDKSCKLFPGGVNSPVRSFKSVGIDPFVVERGEGAYLYDVDGNSYVDFVCSWGPLVLGHAHPEVLAAISEQAKRGTTYGACSIPEIELAELIKNFIPSIELIRFVSSGTEAGMSVLRLARGYTGRQKVLKFAGCYHGHTDSMLVSAGSGVLTLSLPNSPGVTEQTASNTLVAPFNDIASVEEIFAKEGSEIACIILEPVVGNSGLIPPEPGFLDGLRELADKYCALLIFDEVMTGFRVSLHGAQGLYGVKPDITMLGKTIGGGLPVGAFGGKREIMERIAPAGDVYQAGTLSGNPLAMTAGLKTLQLWTSKDSTGCTPFEQSEKNTKMLIDGMKEIANANSIPFAGTTVGTMFGFYFSETPVKNLSDAKNSNIERFNEFFRRMLELGVFFAPSAFEGGFTSISHTEAVIKDVLSSCEIAMGDL